MQSQPYRQKREARPLQEPQDVEGGSFPSEQEILEQDGTSEQRDTQPNPEIQEKELQREREKLDTKIERNARKPHEQPHAIQASLDVKVLKTLSPTDQLRSIFLAVVDTSSMLQAVGLVEELGLKKRAQRKGAGWLDARFRAGVMDYLQKQGKEDKETEKSEAA